MAGRQTVRQRAEELGVPVAARLGLTLWDTEFVKEGASYFLRFYIDKPDGVTLDDCEAFSREIDPMLDEEDFIAEAYYLEVSSPGVERRLAKPEHFAACMGKTVKVRLIRPVDGLREFAGTLTDFSDGTLSVETPEGVRQTELKACAWVRLSDDFDDQQ